MPKQIARVSPFCVMVRKKKFLRKQCADTATMTDAKSNFSLSYGQWFILFCVAIFTISNAAISLNHNVCFRKTLIAMEKLYGYHEGPWHISDTVYAPAWYFGSRTSEYPWVLCTKRQYKEIETYELTHPRALINATNLPKLQFRAITYSEYQC
jgi:hypothetical protein